MGDDFPKLIYHSIICIGALIASRTANGYEVQVVGAPHVGQRTEKELIESFVNKVAQVSPQLVSFNGCAFDLPVLRYRAMVHQVFAPGMHNKAYFHRYTDDNVDLCDVLSSFSYGAKVKLDELSRIMGIAHSPIATSSSATVERASLTSTWPRRFIVLTTRLSAGCSGVSNAGAPAL
jgi:predicted PolB exonuclease-like 3'-5' exonuclease